MGAMSGKFNPVGKLLHARDGGIHTPLDRTAFDKVQAQAAAGDKPKRMEVAGVALRYGVVAHFFFGAMRLEKGSLIEAPGRHRKYRDMMALYSHNSEHVLGRTGNNTFEVAFGEDEVTYRMRLNPDDPMAQSVWARILREDVNASSIGFVPIKVEWVEDFDNSLDAEEAGTKIDILSVTEAHLLEISLVGQGAMAGATSYPSASENPQAEVEGADWRFAPASPAPARQLPDPATVVRYEVKMSEDGQRVIVSNGNRVVWEDAVERAENSPPANAIVEGDDGTETGTADAEAGTPERETAGGGASAGTAGSGAGDEPGGGPQDCGGAAQSDDHLKTQEALSEAAAHGVTLGELLDGAPSDLARRLFDEHPYQGGSGRAGNGVLPAGDRRPAGAQGGGGSKVGGDRPRAVLGGRGRR